MSNSNSLPLLSTINHLMVPTPVIVRPLPILLIDMLATERKVVKSSLLLDKDAEAGVDADWFATTAKIHGMGFDVVGAVVGA